jgi:hypothetical protein
VVASTRRTSNGSIDGVCQLQLTCVHERGRGVGRHGSIGHSEEEHGGETVEGEVCRAEIGGILSRRIAARLLQRPRVVAAALPSRTGCPGQALSSYRDALLEEPL